MAPSPVQKEITAQLVKWGFWAIIALCGAGLVSVANRNVYSKTEIDDKFEAAAKLQMTRDAALDARLNRIEATVGTTNDLVIQLIREQK